MQNKKKSIPPKKIGVSKKRLLKVQPQVDDTIATTKQKTFATIQQTNQFHQHKISTKTTHFSSKRDYLDQMQVHKLSPFSSPGHSVSSRCRRSISPVVVKQKVGKKCKKISAVEKNRDNKKPSSIAKKQCKTPKAKPLSSRKTRTQFQNQFLKRMNRTQGLEPKKITQLSEQQMQGSIRKYKRPIEIKQIGEIHINPKKTEYTFRKKSKEEIIKEMHSKIKSKYKRMYPTLPFAQLKVLSAIVMVQRIWRQKKTRDMISDYLSPRVVHISYQQTIAKHLKQKINSCQSIIEMENLAENTMKTQKSLDSLSQNQKGNFQSHKKNHQTTIKSDQVLFNTPVRSREQLNLKSLELSDELSDCDSLRKSQRILSYINMYRQVVLMSKKDKKKRRKSKPNAFNFPQSLSQKCLLEKFYRQSLKKIDRNQINKNSNKQDKDSDNFLFPMKSLEKSREQFISPKKPEIVQLEERFYTEAQDQDFINSQPVDIIIPKEATKPEDQTVGNISNVAQSLLTQILQQFSEEFYAFSHKKCLKKKRKAPGIPINDDTMRKYLNHFLAFLNQKHTGHIELSYKKITPLSFLKIFRVLPDQDIFVSNCSRSLESQDQDQFSWPVLPNTAFFQYQPIYEEQIFIVKEEDKKYSNFLLGLIKIHNKCLVDCLSEFIEKSRIDALVFPWDTFKPCSLSFLDNKQEQLQIDDVQKNKCELSPILEQIVKISSTKLGYLRSSGSRNRDLDVEQNSLMLSLKEDYKKQGKDWNQYSEYLQIRLEITEAILDVIWKQQIQQLSNILM